MINEAVVTAAVLGFAAGFAVCGLAVHLARAVIPTSQPPPDEARFVLGTLLNVEWSFRARSIDEFNEPVITKECPWCEAIMGQQHADECRVMKSIGIASQWTQHEGNS